MIPNDSELVDDAVESLDASASRLVAIVVSILASVASWPVVAELLSRTPQIPEGVEWLLPVAILVLGYVRVRSPQRWFAGDARFWYPLRRAIGKPLDKALEPIPFLYAKTGAYERELVATFDWSVDESISTLASAGYEPQPLASVAVDWLGRTERASMVRYVGPKPFEFVLPSSLVEQLPEWTRRRQIHARPFAFDESGPTTIVAHKEFNPWRPLLALPHLLGIGLDAKAGVDDVIDDLRVDGENSTSIVVTPTEDTS